MNKKKLLVFGLMGMFATSLVVAIGYYALFSASFTVLPSITMLEDCSDDLGEVYDGDIIKGSECTLTNEAPSERYLSIYNDAGEDIGVTYVGSLDLTKKDSEWLAVGEPITIEYTIIGDAFEVTGVPEGYTAIYYKDEVVGLEGRIVNPQPAISIVGIGNLPQLDDANVDDLANYCAEPDNYNQCKGAKLWIVSNEDLSEGTLNWANMANYYYETDLIQYNAEGKITLSPGASLTITPVYEIGVGVSGEQTVTTTVA